MRFGLTIGLFLSVALTLRAQTAASVQQEDAFFIRKIYDRALEQGAAYAWLRDLTKQAPGRLSGSAEAAAAVEFTRQILDTLGLDRVWLQPCEVPHWVRGETEEVWVAASAGGSFRLRALALGNSVATPPEGLSAEVMEVPGLEAVDSLGFALEGKIAFFNKPMDPTQLNTFAAYGGAVGQRAWGATRAARYGAVGVLVRSMTTALDTVPHTGSLIYGEGPRIPAVAISTLDAEKLSRLLRLGPVRVYMRTSCRMLPPKHSYNVIGEIRGSTHPEEIILVGGHLDAWDVGEGAHDDGAGCVQSMEVLRLLKLLGYRPKRTLRCVLFMNEENGGAGAAAYRDSSNARGEFHLAAMESDRGGFTPRGFTADGHPDTFQEYYARLHEWAPLLEPYGLSFKTGGSGADVSRLKAQKGLLLGFWPDSQRYFDFHHTAIDRFEAVNRRELELGAAAMTALVYLLDKYGLGTPPKKEGSH